MSDNEKRHIARCLEFCSTHNDGIMLLHSNKSVIFRILQHFISDKVDERYVLYASATVLLDLTANENCLNSISKLMQEFRMFDYVVQKLTLLMKIKQKDQ